jgi:deoxyhypusine synthase
MSKIKREDLLKKEVQHIDITKINTMDYVEAQKGMSFSSGEIGKGANIYDQMLNDKKASIILTLAGSSSAAGCMQAWPKMVKCGMIDCVVLTGASAIDMDFFEAIGGKHYLKDDKIIVSDDELRRLQIDRIYDVLIDEQQLQKCDNAIYDFVDKQKQLIMTSRDFFYRLGAWLTKNSIKKDSLIQACYEHGVPMFSAALNDSSAGFGFVKHQIKRLREKKSYAVIDGMGDFRELTEIIIKADRTGLFMIGGGVPKNFVQDTIVCAEVSFGLKKVPMHKWAIQITVADVRDGACSSSTLSEATSWGKLNPKNQQMIFAEATTVVPQIASYLYHKGDWQKRKPRNWNQWFQQSSHDRIEKIYEEFK